MTRIFSILLSSLFICVLIATAQNDTMYIMKNGSPIGRFNVNNQIDSIIFYKPKEIFRDTRDGHIYPLVTIGTQTWFAANLQYGYGTHVTSPSDWVALGSDSAAYSYYDNNANGEKEIYGALYTYAAAIKACPSGWHLPSHEEWKVLEKHIGIPQEDIDKMYRGDGSVLKATTGWTESTGNGTDDYGFSALPSGNRTSKFGDFLNLGSVTYWWTSSEDNEKEQAYNRGIVELADGGSYITVEYVEKNWGFSVRCLKD